MKGNTHRLGRVALACATAATLIMVAPAAQAGFTADCDPVADFDGDGFGDVVAGIPGEQVDGKDGAGAVAVVLGGPSGLTHHDTLWHLATSGVDGVPNAGDNFGAAVATGDFNGDGKDDLAIGAPNDGGAGAVNVLYGSGIGLRANAGGSAPDDQRFTQGTSGIGDANEAGDGFGEALVAGAFNDDLFEDLAIGVPGEDDGGTANTGAVTILYGSASGLTTAGSQTFTQAEAQDTPEAGDRFGSSLAACNFNGDLAVDLAIGVPNEDDGATEAGAVNVIYGSENGLDLTAVVADQYFSQDVADVAGDGAQAEDHFGLSVAAGDFNGDGIADLAVGVPHENLGGLGNPGSVNVIYGGSSGLQVTGSGFPDDETFDQSTAGIDDVIEAKDKFGFAVAAGDFNADGRASLAIGVPGENIGGTPNAGLVHVIEGTGTGLDAGSSMIFHQGLGNFPGEPESGDGFGKVLATGDYGGTHSGTGYGPNDLAIGVPQENIGGISNAGTVVILLGGDSVSFNVPARLSQEGRHYRDDPEAGDRFGAAVD